MRVVCLFILLLSSVVYAELPPLIPREALFSTPVRDFPKISPDGKKLAYLAPSKDGSAANIWVRSLGRADDQMLTQNNKQFISQYQWGFDNNQILFFQDNNGDENNHLKSIDLKTRVVRDLTPFEGIKATNLLAHRKYPHEVLIGLNLRDRKVFDMYRVNLITGAIEIEAENPGDVLSWTADQDFRIRGATAFRSEDLSTVIRVRDRNDAPWRDLVVTAFEQTPWLGQYNSGSLIAGFDQSGKELNVITAGTSNTTSIVKIDVSSAKELQIITQNPNRDLWLNIFETTLRYEIVLDPTSGAVQAAAYADFRPEYQVVDPSIAEDFRALKENNSGVFLLENRDAADTNWIIRYIDDDAPDAFFLYQRAERKLQFLFSYLPELSKYKLAPRQNVMIPARDGMQLYAYLTLPPGIAGKTLPMILYVHGGPWARDEWLFDPYVQWFANRGYAVLQVNFRGSEGFGLKYLNAGTGGWGRGSMQHDLSDAVKWAVAQGIADPEKIAIVGASYGGYATLAGITFTPDLYRCAVDIVGPSDVAMLLKSFPDYWLPVKKRWLRRIGADVLQDEAANKRISPLYHVDKIRVPLLIGHGANDVRTKIEASDKIVKVMRERSLPVTYIVFPNEGHGFFKAENKLDFNGRTEEFLGKCLGGRVEPWKKIEGSSAEQR